MTLQVLEHCDVGLILRSQQTVLLVGRGARDCLRAAQVSIITKRPDTPIALLGVLVAGGPVKLPRIASDGLATSVIGRDWYLVDEAEARDAYGEKGPVVGHPPEAIVWQPSERAIHVPGETIEDGAVVAASYFEPDPD